jgi:hypothetical protein
MKSKLKIMNIEYWFDGMTSCYKVERKDFYNSYLSCFSKFMILFFEDGTTKIINK